MENFEQKYNKALEAVKVLRDSNPSDEEVKNWINDNFPELKESEDERIKELIRNLLTIDNPSTKELYSIYGKSKADAIAWLEKQGESDETKAKMFLINKGYPIDANGTFPTYEEMYDIIKKGLEKQKSGHKVPVKEETGVLKELLDEESTQEEQKSVESVNGEDYGIDGLWHAQRILEKTLGSVEGYQSDDGILEHKAAITAVKNLYEQKPVEWSEEDESTFEQFIDAFRYLLEEYPSTANSAFGGIKLNFTELLAWLKSLRPQPKQEWSKQDIDMIDWLIRDCEKKHEELCNDKYGHQEIVSDLKRDWLESLKNKVVPQNQWKPSKKQIGGT